MPSAGRLLWSVEVDDDVDLILPVMCVQRLAKFNAAIELARVKYWKAHRVWTLDGTGNGGGSGS